MADSNFISVTGKTYNKVLEEEKRREVEGRRIEAQRRAEQRRNEKKNRNQRQEKKIPGSDQYNTRAVMIDRQDLVGSDDQVMVNVIQRRFWVDWHYVERIVLVMNFMTFIMVAAVLGVTADTLYVVKNSGLDDSVELIMASVAGFAVYLQNIYECACSP